MYIEVPPRPPLGPAGAVELALKAGTLTPLYWVLAHRLHTPGLHIQARAFALALRTLVTRRAPPPLRELVRLAAFPLDSVRYFELEFMWRALAAANSPPFRRYLDVSSPRLLPLLVLGARREVTADLINPDGRDLDTSARLLSSTGLADRCRLHQVTTSAASFEVGAFEVITCLSVLEHIPDDADAIRRMWRWLAPGGRLLLSVPCAAEAYEEYVSRDLYGVLAPRADGYTFWQRLYDEAALQERLFAVTGPPARAALFGERTAGLYYRHSRRRMADPRYPVWREPYMVGQEYRHFARPAELPGIGVMALELVKR